MATNKKIPMRKCVGCQEMKSKKELIRIIHTPEDELVVDSTGRKRRIYLSEYGLLFGSKKDKGLGKIFENGDSGRNI